MNKYFVYILRSKNYGKYYVGSTENIEKRIEVHNSGKVYWTKRYLPWELIYLEEYKLISQARKRELQIKSWHSRDSIENLIKSGAFV